MYPIKYRFNITVNGATHTVAPLYGNDLAITFEKENGQQFFRRKLNGKFTFSTVDYAFIVAQPFDTRFVLRMLISRDGGVTWTVYWAGYFYKTDCEFNADDQTVVVTPDSVDDYENVLAGWEKEYNLMDLTLAMTHIEIVKRPMIQIYVPGDNVISCILSSMSWEQEIDPISDEAKLQNFYHFGLISGAETVVVSGATSPSDINGNYSSLSNMNGYVMRSYRLELPEPNNPENTYLAYVQDIVKAGQTEVYWYYESATGYNFDDVTLSPVQGMATGNLRIQRQSTAVYARWVFDNPAPTNKIPYPIQSDDPVYDNRNYHYVYPYELITNVIFYNNAFSTTPTKYGLYQPGQYYLPPTLDFGTPIPIARSTWGLQSIWYRPSQSIEFQEEKSMWQKYVMGNAYVLAAVIQKLLNEIAPDIKHSGTIEFSQFLYGQNPISNNSFNLCLVPKSNILKGNYTEPAQKAPITLRQITDMLRDCFRCFWWIDENKRFRIEHISYFMRGGSYSNDPVVGIDLTKAVVKRTGKPWATAQTAYTFDKPEMPERYQFAWMDDVTQIFKGYPLDIISGYVQQGKIEEINVRNFTSDVDYMLLNPSGCSKDGFALLAAIPESLDFTGGDRALLSDGADSIIATFNPDAFAFPSSVVTLVADSLSAAMNVRIRMFRNNLVAFTETVSIPLNGTYDFTLNTPVAISKIEVSWAAGGSGYVKIQSVDPVQAVDSALELPFITYMVDLNIVRSQNGYLTFQALQDFYMYDMPASNVKRNGVPMTVHGTKKLKRNTVNFPCITDPDMNVLVKTNIGNGNFERLSVNLQSRNGVATLAYDTE